MTEKKSWEPPALVVVSDDTAMRNIETILSIIKIVRETTSRYSWEELQSLPKTIKVTIQVY